MTTETESPANAEADAPLSIDEINSELEAAKPGTDDRTPEDRDLHRMLWLIFHTQSELEALQEWTGQRIRQLQSRVNFLKQAFSPRLEEIARMKLVGKAKSVKTPFGVIGFRAQPTTLNVVDEAVVLKMPDFVRIPPPQVNKKALNEHFDTTGEVPDGCEVILGGEKFYVK